MTDRIAALHFMVTANIAGVQSNFRQLKTDAGSLAPALQQMFKGATDELKIYDRELERLVRKVGRGSANASDIARMGELSAFWQNRQSTTPAPQLQRDPTYAAFGGFSPSQLAERNAWEAQQNALRQRMEIATTAGDLYARTRPPEMFGPARPDASFFRQREQQQDAGAYQAWLQRRAGGMSQGEINAGLGYNADEAAWRQSLAARSAGMNRMQGRPTDFSAMQSSLASTRDASAYEAWLSRNARGAPQAEVEAARGTDISRMNGPQLQALRGEYTALAASGQNVRRQLEEINRAMFDMSVREDMAAQSTRRLNNEAQQAGSAFQRLSRESQEFIRTGAGAGAAGLGATGAAARNRLAMGAGSDVRRFRYASQNLAYGVEDAMVSYGLGGTKAAFRAAGNNISALASLIPNPYISAGAILGTAVGTTFLPPMIDYVSQGFTGRDEGDAINDRLKGKFGEAGKARDLADLLANGDASSNRSGYNKAKGSVATLQDQLRITREEEAKQRAIMARTSYTYDGGNSYGAYGKAYLAAASGVSGLFNEHNGKYATDRAEYLTADKSRELLQQQAAELEKQLQIEQQSTEKLKERQTLLDQRVVAEKALAQMSDQHNADLTEYAKVNGLYSTPQDFNNRQWDKYQEKLDWVNKHSDRIYSPEEKDRMRRQIDDEYGSNSENWQMNRKKYAAYRRELEEQEKGKAAALNEDITTTKDPRRSIDYKYERQRNAIESNQYMSEFAKERLLKLSAENQAKEYEKYDKAQQKPYKDAPTLNGIDVGSRADAELRQKYLGGGSEASQLKKLAEDQLRVQQEARDALKSIEKNAGKGGRKSKLK